MLPAGRGSRRGLHIGGVRRRRRSGPVSSAPVRLSICPIRAAYGGTAARLAGLRWSSGRPVSQRPVRSAAGFLLRVDSQPQVESLAAEAVAPVWSEPRLRTSTLSVDLVRSGGLVDVAALLAVDVGDVLEVDGLPAAAPAGARRWSVRRVTDRLSTSSWVRRFDVAAAGEPLAVFRVGVDVLDGPAVVGW